MHTCMLIERNAVRYPKAVALEENGRQVTWREFRDQVAGVAAGLRNIGVANGDRVAILAENSAAYISLTYATQWLGGISVPINTRWTPDEVAFALDDCGASILVVDAIGAACFEDIAARIRDKIRLFSFNTSDELTFEISSLINSSRDATPPGKPETNPVDIASIFYTGGTTGRPKGVQLTHSNHVIHSLALAAELQLPHGIRHLHVAPMFHIADSLFFHVVAALGGTHLIIPRFDVSTCAEALSSLSVDQTILVPTMIGMMMNDPAGLEGLQKLGRLFYGASPMPQALLERIMNQCPQLELVQLYGQTESSPVLTVLDNRDHRIVGGTVTRSAGRAILGAEVAIFDPLDRPLPIGAHGEIVARGPQITPGYLNRQEDNTSTFRSGWLHTGDAGYIDKAGYVHVTDRIKDMIITGGENVYSVEVEQVIYDFHGVDQCCVVGVPHEKWGEAVHAVVVPKESHELDCDAILAHCAAKLANYKRPLDVTIRQGPLPVSGAGKILKRVVRDEMLGSAES